MRRQLAAELLAQLYEPEPIARPSHHEGHDPFISRLVFPHFDHGAFQIRVPVQTASISSNSIR